MPDRRSGDAALLLLAEVDFDQDLDHPVPLGGLGLDLLRESETVDGVDQSDRLDDFADLVALELTDHVPARLRNVDRGRGLAVRGEAIAELLDLGGAVDELLGAILTEVAMAEREQLADDVDGRVLGDRDQHHVVGVLPDLRGSLGDPGLHELVTAAEARIHEGGILHGFGL